MSTNPVTVNMYEAELGKMTEIVSFLEIAATQKDYKRAERILRAYLNSISVMRGKESISSKHTILSISRTFSGKDRDVMYEFYWEIDDEF